MSTESKLYWGAGIVSVLVFIGSFLLPGEPVNKADLPWNIEHPAPGATRVFGLTLGTSTTNDAEQYFREEAKISLFKSPQGVLTVEAFFEQVNLAELKAKIVVSVAVSEAELQGMYERGLRMSGIASGKKVTLTADDTARVRALPIAGLTYMPSVRLEEELIGKRFGPPSQRIREKESGALHWLYPQHGLDITLGSDGRPVLQYVPPGEFDKLLQPLSAGGEAIN
ncbi:MAG: hypothetical protein A2Z95_04600 [Gallionellales bacterium GWA2_60_18]|nr:MAG: hypothetical protein A2Z95_04600 [Gallionellales bacterium GWA2_60_18]